jgi:O-antigen/teichoic acid export membrane protein
MTTTADLVGGGLAIALIIAPIALPIVFGRGYRDAGWLFVVLALGLTPQLFATPIGNALGGEGRVGLSALISGAGFLVAIVCVPLGALLWGELGAAGGLSLSAALSGTGLIWVSVRRYGVDIRVFRSVALVAIAAVIASMLLAVGLP